MDRRPHRARMLIMAAFVLVTAAFATVASTFAHTSAPTPRPASRMQQATTSGASASEFSLHSLLGCANPKQLKRAGICHTRAGLLRVRLRSGKTVYTHGGDPRHPRSSVTTGGFSSTASYLTPAASQIQCASAGARAFQLVYAYPTGQTPRTAVPAQLAAQFELASAFVSEQAHAANSAASAKLVVNCVSGVPSVPSVALPPLTATTPDAVFRQVASELGTAGYGQAGVHYVVFWDVADGGSWSGYGTANMDPNPGPTNQLVTHTDPQYALQFRAPSSDVSAGNPYWQYLLHEATHTMGGVMDSWTAGFHDTGASTKGHCYIGPDIMCYDDGGIPAGQKLQPTACSGTAYKATANDSATRYDCNGDAYFNVAPKLGSWLSMHWNIAFPANPYMATVLPADTTAPAAPAAPSVTQSAAGVASLTWAQASDDRGPPPQYRITRATPGGAFTAVGTSNGLTFTDPGLAADSTEQYEIQAVDAVGNISVPSAAVSVTIHDTTAPSAPAALRVTAVTASTMTLAWTAATDDVGVAGYHVRLLVNGAYGTVLNVSAPATVATVTNLQPGTHYSVLVSAFDAAGNESAVLPTPAGTFLAVTQTPSNLLRTPRVHSTAIRRGVVMRWKAVPAATRYAVLRAVGKGRFHRVQLSSKRTFTDRSLRPKGHYRYKVIALAPARTSIPYGPIAVVMP